MLNATTISVLVPVYNEVKLLATVLDRIEAVDFCGLAKQIIVVDDGSTDGTRELMRVLEGERADRGYCFRYHGHNQGKGAALRTALSFATGDVIVVQDADLEYDPQDYPPLIRLLLVEQADVVYGTRFFGGARPASYGLHYAGNKLLTAITNLLYGTALTDMETCYKAFRADVIKSFEIRSDRFDFEPEITAKVLKRGYRIREAPISYAGRTFESGKKITWKDGIAAVRALLRFRFND